MIEYIKGELALLTPAMAVIEAAGVGYALNISLNTYDKLKAKTDRIGNDGNHTEPVKLLVHESIVTGGRDDSITLYGFLTEEERTLYRLLISVSGVGANTARMILSSMSPEELTDAITDGDERQLKAVKGIGLKTAQRIIVDLKDKMPEIERGERITEKGVHGAPSVNAVVKQEAVGALTMLGFSPAPTSKVVTQLLTENPELTVEQVVKLALKQIK